MNDAQKMELDRIARSDGLLRPERVVEVARDPENPLHTQFEWDDSEAAQLYRVQQARGLIRVYVTHLPRVDRKVRAYVSTPSDRATTGGYRPVQEVMDSPAWTAEMFNEVEAKIRGLRRSYAYLAFLSPLFDRLEAAVSQFRVEMDERRAAG